MCLSFIDVSGTDIEGVTRVWNHITALPSCTASPTTHCQACTRDVGATHLLPLHRLRQGSSQDSSALPPSERYNREIQSRLGSAQAQPLITSSADPAVFFSARDLSQVQDKSNTNAPNAPTASTAEQTGTATSSLPRSSKPTGQDSTNIPGVGSSSSSVPPTNARGNRLEAQALQALDRIEQSALLSVSALGGDQLQPLDLLQPLISRMEMLASSITMLEGRNIKLMGEVSALSYSRDTVEAGRDVLLGEREQLVGQLKQANIAAEVSVSCSTCSNTGCIGF